MVRSFSSGIVLNMEDKNVSLGKDSNETPKGDSPPSQPSTNPTELPLGEAPATTPENKGSGGDQFFNSIRSWGITRANDRVVGGVASGFARKWGVAPNAVRLLLALSIIISGIGIIAYALAWAFLPEEKDGRIHAQELLKGNFDGALVGIVLLLLIGGDSDAHAGFFNLDFRGIVLLALVGIAIYFSWDSLNNSNTSDGEKATVGNPESTDKVSLEKKRKRSVWYWIIWPLLILFILMTLFVNWMTGDSDEDLRSYSNSKIEVESVSQAEEGFRLGFGETTLDFRELSPEDSITIPIEAKSGQITILIPEGLDVEATADVSVGEVTWEVANSRSSLGGINVSERFDTDFEGRPDIRFEVSLDVGSIEFK